MATTSILRPNHEFHQLPLKSYSSISNHQQICQARKVRCEKEFNGSMSKTKKDLMITVFGRPFKRPKQLSLRKIILKKNQDHYSGLI